MYFVARPVFWILQEEAGNADDIQTSVDKPTLDEVQSTVRKLRNGRAPGVDGIPAELLKCVIGPVSAALYQLFIKVWRSGMVSGWQLTAELELLSHYIKGKDLRMNMAIIAQLTIPWIPGKVFVRAQVFIARIHPLLNLRRHPQCCIVIEIQAKMGALKMEDRNLEDRKKQDQ